MIRPFILVISSTNIGTNFHNSNCCLLCRFSDKLSQTEAGTNYDGEATESVASPSFILTNTPRYLVAP